MSSNECIIPECYIDSCLIEVLLHADREHVNHQKGNGTVAREMKNKFREAFCVRIIDEDRKELDYLKEFDPINETDCLRFWKHRDKHHFMIQLRPVIENWIISACEKVGILLKDYYLPGSVNELKRISKSVASKKDPRFVKLFKDLVKKESEPVLQLKNWLEYLKTNKFNVDVNRLKNG